MFALAMAYIKLLIIEDENIVAEDLAERLMLAGYEVVAVLNNGEEAINLYPSLKPDLIMADIQLKGKMDGIETITRIQQMGHTPVIYLTALGDQHTWQRAKLTKPAAFLTKPFRERDIHSAIELAIASGVAETSAHHSPETSEPCLYRLEDRCFIRANNGRFEKYLFQDLLYLEAERSYCRLITTTRSLLLSEPLQSFHEKLAHPHFVRVHRSYVVNITHIDAIDHQVIVLGNQSIPVGSSYRDTLFEQIRMLQ